MHPPCNASVPGKRTRFLLACVLAAAAATACNDAAVAPAADGTAVVPALNHAALAPEVRQDLAALRRATAPFHDLQTAMDAGWNVPLTGCLASPEGGMGFHYANLSALGDPGVAVETPETLLYAPGPNGQLQLVAVEYIVPLDASPTPPRLFGRDFHANTEVGIWALHAWVWRANPSGMFADWNPLVSCP